MYSDTVITELKNRIGFGLPGDDTINISTSNQTGTSGRTFRYFHQLVTVDNIYKTCEIKNVNQAKFDAFLDQIKIDSVKSVLTAVFDRNEAYLDSEDYSDMISSKATLFDDATGYAVAITILEQMISSKRMNLEERNISATYEQLKIELEGAKNERGFRIASGLKAKYSNAISEIINIIFPIKPTVSSKPIW